MSTTNRNVPSGSCNSRGLVVFSISSYLLNEENFSFPQDTQAAIKPDPHDNLVFWSGEDLVNSEHLKESAFKPDHIIICHRPFMFETHNVRMVCRS